MTEKPIELIEWLEIHYSLGSQGDEVPDYLPEEDLELIRQTVTSSLEEGDPQTIEELKKIAENPKLDNIHARQLQQQITLGYIDYLLLSHATGNPTQEIKNILFNNKANPQDSGHQLLSLSIIGALGDKLPELSLRILNYYQDPDHPGQYASLAIETMAAMPQHQAEIAQQAARFFNVLTNNHQEHAHAVNSAISGFIRQLLHSDFKDNWHQLLPIAAELLQSITETNDLTFSAHQILRFIITHPKELPADSHKQIKQQVLESLNPDRLGENFFAHPYSPDILTDIIWATSPDQSQAWIQQLTQARSPVADVFRCFTPEDIQRIKQGLTLNEAEQLFGGIIHLSEKGPFITPSLNQNLAEILIKAGMDRLIISLAVPHPDTLYKIYKEKGSDAARKLAQKMGLNLAKVLRPYIAS